MASMYDCEDLLYKEIANMREQLKKTTTDLENLKESLAKTSLDHHKTQKQLDETKKSLKAEQSQRKQSSTELKKRITELTLKNEELLRELEEVKNLQVSEKKPSNLENVSKFQRLEGESEVPKELAGLRMQRKLDVNYIKKLKEELKKSNEKVMDLENVLEAHQIEIDDLKDELNTSNEATATETKDTKPKGKPNAKKGKDAEEAALTKILDDIIKTRRKAVDVSNYLNSSNNKQDRTNFDEQVQKMKNGNNALIESIKVVKLTVRGFEDAEKELTRIREKNNQIIKLARKQALDCSTKVKALCNQFTQNLPSFRASIEECKKLLADLEKINLNDIYKSEEILQEELVKKLRNENEFLNTILSKQHTI